MWVRRLCAEGNGGENNNQCESDAQDAPKTLQAPPLSKPVAKPNSRVLLCAISNRSPLVSLLAPLR